MSINFCTLTSSSVDSFCGNQRSKILTRLIPILHPPHVPGTGAGTPHTDAVYQAYMRARSREHEKWEPPPVPTELERVVVEVTFANIKGSDAQDIKPGFDLVTVTDLTIEPTKVDVNITDLKVH